MLYSFSEFLIDIILSCNLWYEFVLCHLNNVHPRSIVSVKNPYLELWDFPKYPANCATQKFKDTHHKEMILWDIPNHPAICVSQKFIYLDLRRNANVAESQSRIDRVQKIKPRDPSKKQISLCTIYCYWTTVEKNQTMGSF